MRVIEVYEAEDGSQWASREEALRREDSVRSVACLMRPLGCVSFSEPGDQESFYEGKAFIQHNHSTVVSVREDLFLYCCLVLDGFEDRFRGKDSDISWFVVFFDTCHWETPDPRYLPIYEAWLRLQRIDYRGREWTQVYYVLFPDDHALPIKALSLSN